MHCVQYEKQFLILKFIVMRQFHLVLWIRRIGAAKFCHRQSLFHLQIQDKNKLPANLTKKYTQYHIYPSMIKSSQLLFSFILSPLGANKIR